MVKPASIPEPVSMILSVLLVIGGIMPFFNSPNPLWGFASCLGATALWGLFKLFARLWARQLVFSLERSVVRIEYDWPWQCRDKEFPLTNVSLPEIVVRRNPLPSGSTGVNGYLVFNVAGKPVDFGLFSHTYGPALGPKCEEHLRLVNRQLQPLLWRHFHSEDALRIVLKNE